MVSFAHTQKVRIQFPISSTRKKLNLYPVTVFNEAYPTLPLASNSRAPVPLMTDFHFTIAIYEVLKLYLNVKYSRTSKTGNNKMKVQN